ncbi:hypothetical protein DFH06DRAFT_947808, partial [Mycena polygramma]
YQPGFEDLSLTWGKGGAPAVYVQYEANLNNLLARPEAVAFIAMGGILRYVAELYEENLVYRFAQGPSLQVTQFDKGAAYLYLRGGEEEFYTTDQVSHSEVGILLGVLPGAHPGQLRTLWPTPELFESESPHMRGYLSEGAYAILENIRREIFVSHDPRWRTRAQWREYFRVGCKRIHEPAVVPSDKDFKDGEDLFRRSFPVSWLNMEIPDIILPEE